MGGGRIGGMTITLPPPFKPSHAVLTLHNPKCDICQEDGIRRDLVEMATFDAWFDGFGWAYACTRHFLQLKGRTGLGKGQALISSDCFNEETLERIRLMNKES